MRYGSTCCTCLVLVWISKCSALYSVLVQPTYTGCRTALASIQLPILTAGSFDTRLPQREKSLMDQKAAVLWGVHRDKDKDKHGNEDEAQVKHVSCRRSATNRAAVRNQKDARHHWCSLRCLLSLSASCICDQCAEHRYPVRKGTGLLVP